MHFNCWFSSPSTVDKCISWIQEQIIFKMLFIFIYFIFRFYCFLTEFTCWKLFIIFGNYFIYIHLLSDREIEILSSLIDYFNKKFQKNLLLLSFFLFCGPNLKNSQTKNDPADRTLGTTKLHTIKSEPNKT